MNPLLLNVLVGFGAKVLEPVGNLILGKVIDTRIVEEKKVVQTETGHLKEIEVEVEKPVRKAPPLAGSRTIIVGLTMAILPALLEWVAGFDWSQYVSVSTATIICGIATLALRLITAYSGRV